MTHNLDILLALIAGILVGCTSIYVGDSMELFLIKTACAFFLFYLIGKFFRKRFAVLLKSDEDAIEDIDSTEDELILKEDHEMDQEQAQAEDDAGIDK